MSVTMHVNYASRMFSVGLRFGVYNEIVKISSSDNNFKSVIQTLSISKIEPLLSLFLLM